MRIRKVHVADFCVSVQVLMGIGRRRENCVLGSGSTRCRALRPDGPDCAHLHGSTIDRRFDRIRLPLNLPWTPRLALVWFPKRRVSCSLGCRMLSAVTAWVA